MSDLIPELAPPAFQTAYRVMWDKSRDHYSKAVVFLYLILKARANALKGRSGGAMFSPLEF